MDEEVSNETIDLPHHQQSEFCRTRPAYRQGRKLTAVKAYTINSESTHLLIFGVPKINLRQELKSLLQKNGKIKFLQVSPVYPHEEFTECYHVNFENLQSSRKAKRNVDMRCFYGSVLHVCYAPELETCDETKQKLNQRKIYVYRCLEKLKKQQAIENNLKQKTILSSESSLNYKNVPATSQNGLVNQCNSTCPVISPSQYYPTTYLDNTVVTSSGPIMNENLYNSTDIVQNEVIEDVSEANYNNEKPQLKRPNDSKNYVFRKKKRKKSKNISNTVSNPKSIDPNSSQSNSQNFDVNDLGKISVFENIENPQIRHIPKKTTNRIIMKINTKLI